MHSRYVGRKEFFGSLLFDREAKDYMAFDADETGLFTDGAMRAPVNSLEQERFEAFLATCIEQGAVDGAGRFLHPWKDFVTRDGILSAPLKISLNITTGCNLRCRHCYSSARDENRRDMSVENACRLIDEMAMMGVQCLSVKGGEPFHHPDIMEILSYAGIRGVSVTIITNGLLIDEEKARKLNDTSVDYLTVSIDGARAETHEHIRGKGTFPKVLESIRILKACFNKPVFIYYTLNSMNVAELPELYALAGDLKSDRLRVRPVLPTGRASECGGINLNGREYREALLQIRDLSMRHRMPVDLPHSESLDINSNVTINPGLYSFGCVAGNSFIHMDPDGNIYPCQYLESSGFLAGNMFSQSFKEIWDDSPVFREFRSFKGNGTCLACPYFKGCRGGCRARALYLRGDINAPEPWCLADPCNSQA